jgi:protein involved in polysaccharide export with SLBB domain
VCLNLNESIPQGEGNRYLPDGAVITVEKRQPQPYHVIGLVNKPGQFEYPVNHEVRVLEAIAQAGSYNEAADLRKCTLTRKSGDVINLDLYKLYVKGDTTQNLVLTKGDTIYVPEDTVRKIYVLGEVQRPGMYPLKDDMTALSAVSMAGGPIPERGKLKGTLVIRGNETNPEKIKVDIGKIWIVLGTQLFHQVTEVDPCQAHG